MLESSLLFIGLASVFLLFGIGVVVRLGDVDVEVIVGLVMFPRATLAATPSVPIGDMPAATAIVSWRRLFFDFDFDIACSVID